MEQKKLDAEAHAKGLSIMPDCGLAPGMVNILAAEGIRRLDHADRVRIFVGGLPQHPEPPLNYQIVYSLEGALDYYTTPSWILRDGKRTTVDALSELEFVDFPAPVGTLEAFHTGGGISTMPFTWEGKIREMEYKTLRYPGHVAIMKPIRDLGLLDLEPTTVKGQAVVPRDVFIACVEPQAHEAGWARPGGAPDHRERDEARQASGHDVRPDRSLRRSASRLGDDADHRLLAVGHRARCRRAGR